MFPFFSFSDLLGHMNRILKMSTIHPQMTWIRNLNQRMNFKLLLLQKIKRLLSIREFSVSNSPLYLLFPFFQLRVCKDCIQTGLRSPRNDVSGSLIDIDIDTLKNIQYIDIVCFFKDELCFLFFFENLLLCIMLKLPVVLKKIITREI